MAILEYPIQWQLLGFPVSLFLSLCVCNFVHVNMCVTEISGFSLRPILPIRIMRAWP